MAPESCQFIDLNTILPYFAATFSHNCMFLFLYLF